MPKQKNAGGGNLTQSLLEPEPEPEQRLHAEPEHLEKVSADGPLNPFLPQPSRGLGAPLPAAGEAPHAFVMGGGGKEVQEQRLPTTHFWAELSEPERQAAQVLQWSADSWERGEFSPSQLRTTEEFGAASVIGHTPETWLAAAEQAAAADCSSLGQQQPQQPPPPPPQQQQLSPPPSPVLEAGTRMSMSSVSSAMSRATSTSTYEEIDPQDEELALFAGMPFCTGPVLGAVMITLCIVDWAHVVLAVIYMISLAACQDNELALVCCVLYILKISSHAGLVLFRMHVNGGKAISASARW